MRDLDLQAASVAIGTEVFGEANMISKEERLLRFTEEALELIRAAGMKFDQLAAMMVYEYYQRSPGELSQEIAGTQCTLYSLADANDVDVRIVTLKELDRVLAKKDHCRAKHAAKPASMRAA